MPLAAAEFLVALFQSYTAVGAIFAILFVARGVDRVDPLARGAGRAFRLLITPGTIVFWPVLLYRWRRGVVVPPTERNAHRRRARGSR